MKKIYILVLLISFACNAPKSSETSKDSINATITTDTIAAASEIIASNPTTSGTLQVITKSGLLLLELNPETMKVNVYKENKSTPILQTLGPIESDIDFSSDYYSSDAKNIFKPEDLNFDGNSDIKIITTSGSGGEWYDVYLFNPQTGLFEQNSELSKLTSLRADAVKKKLYMHDIGGMAGGNYNFSIYHWEGNALVLEQQEAQDQVSPDNEELFSRYILTFKNNKADTLATVLIKMRSEKSVWCIQKGKKEDLYNSPNAPENDAIFDCSK